MESRLLCLICLCLVAKVYGAAYGEDCTQDTDCSAVDPLTKCDTGNTDKCICVDTHARDGSACKVKQGGACTGTDASICVKYTTCANNLCTCINPGSKVDGDVCTQVYDATCTVAAVATDCTDRLPNSECTGTPLKCKCVAAYKSSGTPPTCMKVIGSICTANTDCSGVTDAECSTGELRTCTCKAGYMGATTCTKRTIGDTCAIDGDCSAAVTNSFCQDVSGTKTCAKIYEKKSCTDDAGCNGLKYGKCKASKCSCNDDSVVEMDDCKLKIDGTCATGDICPNNAACTGSKCKCNNNYEKKDEKCTATNSGMTVMASLMLMVTALATVLLQ